VAVFSKKGPRSNVMASFSESGLQPAIKRRVNMIGTKKPTGRNKRPVGPIPEILYFMEVLFCDYKAATNSVKPVNAASSSRTSVICAVVTL
jgi:hypothetical protein